MDSMDCLFGKNIHIGNNKTLTEQQSIANSNNTPATHLPSYPATQLTRQEPLQSGASWLPPIQEELLTEDQPEVDFEVKKVEAKMEKMEIENVKVSQ